MYLIIQKYVYIVVWYFIIITNFIQTYFRWAVEKPVNNIFLFLFKVTGSSCNDIYLIIGVERRGLRFVFAQVWVELSFALPQERKLGRSVYSHEQGTFDCARGKGGGSRVLILSSVKRVGITSGPASHATAACESAWGRGR